MLPSRHVLRAVRRIFSRSPRGGHGRLGKSRSPLGACLLAGLSLVAWTCAGGSIRAAERLSPHDAAVEVDRLLNEALAANGQTPTPRTADGDFLRRAMLDLVGVIPGSNDITLFTLDPAADKRTVLVNELLADPRFAETWAGYWSDVIFMRATEQRAAPFAASFEAWMQEQLLANRPWSAIATDLLTATGDVRENGAAALMFVQSGEPEDLAAEASRLFLGIQIQCANCHDHPSDIWKREQFHQLAAYFPRVRVRPKMDVVPRSFEVVSFDAGPGRRDPSAFLNNPEQLFRALDRNRDQKLDQTEANQAQQFARIFERMLEYGDTDKDGAITIAEFKAMPRPEGIRTQTEHYMQDLEHPNEQGALMQPVFFVSGDSLRTGASDLERRRELARLITSEDNPWFARALVNRIWAELLGEGFYAPVDDLGPSRNPRHAEAMEVLATGFTQSGYDLRWLYRAILRTDAYQRELSPEPRSGSDLPFASALPTRLRAAQIYNSLLKVAGLVDSGSRAAGYRPVAGGGAMAGSPKAAFDQLFRYDPSTPQDDITGDIPQALFLMNSERLAGMFSARGGVLAGILASSSDNDVAVSELYLRTVSREPTAEERELCRAYLRTVSNRSEGFEDLLWALLNSSEFISKR